MTIAWVGGVDGSNLGQTKVELSGLNHVFHKLGPQGEWLSTFTDSLTCQVISPPTWGVYKPVKCRTPWRASSTAKAGRGYGAGKIRVLESLLSSTTSCWPLSGTKN